MASNELTGRARELLAEPNYATLSTLRKDGTIHNVVVWVDVDDAGNVTANTAEGRVWRKNITRNPTVTVTAYQKDNPYEFVSVTGTVVEDTHDGADEHIDALAKKYLGVDSYPYRSEEEVRVRFTIKPEKVSFTKAG